MEKYEGKFAENTQLPEDSQEQAGLDQVLRILGDMEESKKKEMRLVSRLREDQKGPTVFFLPGTEGFAKVMRIMASRLDAHIIAVQYTHDMGFETIQDMAKNLVPVRFCLFLELLLTRMSGAGNSTNKSMNKTYPFLLMCYG
nr:unnamed protein product [Callosobruchus analis]